MFNFLCGDFCVYVYRLRCCCIFSSSAKMGRRIALVVWSHGVVMHVYVLIGNYGFVSNINNFGRFYNLLTCSTIDSHLFSAQNVDEIIFFQ